MFFVLESSVMMSVGSPSSLSKSSRDTSLAYCEYRAKLTPVALTVAPSGYHFPADTTRTFLCSCALDIMRYSLVTTVALHDQLRLIMCYISGSLLPTILKCWARL